MMTSLLTPSHHPPLSLGFSPCPNDTFIFHALVHGRVQAGGMTFAERIEDVETLNHLVLDRALDISKISYHLLGHVRGDYCLLRAGGALGRGCGPLLVAREPLELDKLKGKRIAVPGRYTTAALLLRLFDPDLTNMFYLPFHEIMPAVAEGKVDAGVIIHESRFTFAEYGLVKLLDLGDWWEKETGHPIPLGGIVARRSLGREVIATVDAALQASVEYALAHRGEAFPYIRSHSQEMSDEVCSSHIDLYVNPFSVDLGDDGEDAVKNLLARAENAGIIPPSSAPLFLE